MPNNTTQTTVDTTACAPIGWTAAVNTFNDARRFQKDLRPGTWLAMSSAARHYNASQRKRHQFVQRGYPARLPPRRRHPPVCEVRLPCFRGQIATTAVCRGCAAG